LGHQDPGEFPEEVKSLFEKAVEYYEENMVLMVEIQVFIYQCCGAGPILLCDSGSSLSKISAPALTMFPIRYILEKIKKFSWFKEIFMLFKILHSKISKRFFKVISYEKKIFKLNFKF
jgi:hypothetical protein